MTLPRIRYCMSDTLKQKFEDALDDDAAAAFTEIEVKVCSSDNYDGRQYNIHGAFVPLMPLIDVVAAEDGVAIEQIWHKDEHEACAGLFVADLPERSHPAFVD